MTALEQAQAEAEHYKMLFVSASAYYAQDLPYGAERAEFGEHIIPAMEAIEARWIEKYGEHCDIKELVLAELKRIGGQNG